MEYALDVAIIICLYATVALAVNLVAGVTGLVSLAHAALMGVGAYTTALLATQWGFGFFPCLVLSLILGSLVSTGLGFISVRTRDEFFVLATFAAQIVFTSAATSWYELTSGPRGVPQIPPAEILGYVFNSRISMLLLSGVVLVIASVLSYRTIYSSFGLVLKGIKENESLAKSFGKDVARYKLKVFILSGSLTSMSGVLLAYYNAYIDPTFFTVNESIRFLTMVILGGAGTFWGPIWGASVLVGVPEVFRLFLPSSVALHLRQILFGAVLVLCAMYRRKGLIRK